MEPGGPQDAYPYSEVPPLPILGRRFMDAVFDDGPFPPGLDAVVNKYIRAHRIGMLPEELDSGRSGQVARPHDRAVHPDSIAQGLDRAAVVGDTKHFARRLRPVSELAMRRVPRGT
jgi:hypothetical protein